jgi:uncharacterized protein (TIRG00374 family)
LSRQRFLRGLRGVLGFVLALVLVGWVVVRSGIDPAEVLASVHRGLFLAAFLVYGVGFLSASWRWYLLLDHIRVKLPFPTVLRLALIGLFFNLFVPGGVGGDLIKMVYLKRESGQRYPQALLTVLLDRLMGLAGLLALAVVALLMNSSMLSQSSPEMRGALSVVGLAMAGALLCGLAFLGWPLISRWGARAGAQAWAARLPASLVAIAQKVAEALDLLRAAPMKLAALLLLSTVGHLTASLGVYLIAQGLPGGSDLSFLECLLATQLANLVASIPLTPGGLGGRDLIMSVLLRSAGASVALAGSVPVMVSVLLVVWSLVGGLALLWERGAGVVSVESKV